MREIWRIRENAIEFTAERICARLADVDIMDFHTVAETVELDVTRGKLGAFGSQNTVNVTASDTLGANDGKTNFIFHEDLQ
jgi:hypothetical protein